MISRTMVPAPRPPSPPPSASGVDVVVGICTGPAGSRSSVVVVVRGMVTTGPAGSVVVGDSVVVVSNKEVVVSSGNVVVVDGSSVTVDWLRLDVLVVVVSSPIWAEAGSTAAADITTSAPARTIH